MRIIYYFLGSDLKKQNIFEYYPYFCLGCPGQVEARENGKFQSKISSRILRHQFPRLVQGSLNKTKKSNVDRSSKRVNSYKGNLSDWLRDSMITKVFNDVATSLKEGKQINLKEIGIKRTPYTKLINQERAEKAVVKRKDFIDILNREQNIVLASKRRKEIKESKVYKCLEKNLNLLSGGSERITGKYSNVLSQLMKNNESSIGQHLKKLRFSNGSYKIPQNKNY